MSLFHAGLQPAIDSNGDPISGATWNFYATGTTTPVAVYADSDLSTSLGAVVTANSVGRFADIYLDDVIYRAILKDAGGASLADIDPVSEPIGATTIMFTQSGTGAVTTTVQAKLREGAVSAADFSTVAQAVATGKDVFFPAGTWSFDQVIVTTPGQRFYGEGPATIVRASDATKDLFLVRVADVRFSDLRMEGASTSETNGTFAIKTDSAYPAPRLRIENVQFSGADSAKGFNNGVKFDTGADYGTVYGCYFERLWGNDSGYGYGVLCGAAEGVVAEANSGIGTAGRGRHFIYFSAGASRCKAIGNDSEGFDSSAIAIYATDAQTTCDSNVVAFNTLINPALTGGFTLSGIEIYQNVQNTLVIGNTVRGSGGRGIMLDGTSSTKLKNNRVVGNTVENSQYIGIDVISMQGGEISGNRIIESGLASAGTYANIRLVSDGTTATSDLLITGNRSLGPTYSRSAFQINSTSPTPTSLKVYGNKFSVCNLTDVELGGVTCAIDGRIRFTQGSVSYGPIANGAALSTAYTVNGADQGDTVTVGHTSDCDGCSVTAYANGSNAVTVTVLNNSGGSKTIASGTLRIDVWKREP